MENTVKLVWHVGRAIPEICTVCKFVDYEIGEFGSILCPSYCTKNIWMPTKSGTCKKFVEHKQFKKEVTPPST